MAMYPTPDAAVPSTSHFPSGDSFRICQTRGAGLRSELQADILSRTGLDARPPEDVARGTLRNPAAGPGYLTDG